MERIVKEKKTFPHKLVLIAAFVCMLLLFILLNVTSPDNTSPALLLIMFVLMYGTIFGLFNVAVVFFQNFSKLVFPDFIKKQPSSLRKTYSYIAIVSCVPIFILAVQSIKPISGFELLLVLLLASLACFVVHKK